MTATAAPTPAPSSPPPPPRSTFTQPSPRPSPGGGAGTGGRRGPVLVASDLDRTLIYSAAALALTGPDHEAPRLLTVECYQSRPLSYLTETAAGLLAELTRRAVFVPVTTRTEEQYRRVRLPGRPSRYAVCANGGKILVDGVSEPEWERRVRAAVADGCAPLPEVRERLLSTADPAWLRKERTAEDLFCYLVVERDAFPAAWAEEVAAWAEPRGWQLSVQGRKVYLVPRPLTKGAAVTELAARTGAATTLAAGDSLLDIDLLLAADRGWVPGHGELAADGWTAPGMTSLTRRGVLCGEEILRAMLDGASRNAGGATGGARGATGGAGTAPSTGSADAAAAGRPNG